MSRFIEVLSINENIAVEVDPKQELYREKQAFKQLIFRPLKRLAQWGISSFIKGQIGALMGSLGASLLPAMAISGALLIATLALYFSLIHPEVSALAPAILGMALGVIAHV